VKIAFLYAEVMGYTMATIKSLAELGAEVHLVHWDTNKLTPYQAPGCENVFFYPRSLQTSSTLLTLLDQASPDITVVSGWSDKLYLSAARHLRKQGKIVVSGFDNQWHATAKQRLAAALGCVRYFSRYFSHAWVAGVYQYEYVRRLGFHKHEVICNLYSADTPLYRSAYQLACAEKARKYPHRFLYVGRLEPIKGLDVLLASWNMLGSERRDWELHLIGNGSLKPLLASEKSIVLRDFMDAAQLVHQAADAGCFILPSKIEPWGVVVHEFAAAGLPLILSDVVGASTAFLLPGWNGFLFQSDNPEGLASAMKKIIASSDSLLMSMGHNSHHLSRRITPNISAASLLSVMDRSM
jgi:glycosyltransferase involved in cell wall biosynthesis